MVFIPVAWFLTLSWLDLLYIHTSKVYLVQRAFFYFFGVGFVLPDIGRSSGSTVVGAHPLLASIR